MTYFRDVYKKRGQWWGETSKEQYTNIAKTYFTDYLLNSPNDGVIIVDNIEIPAAIHENKQDENKISKYFLVDLDVTTIVPGKLISWADNYWLVLQKEMKSFEAYNKYLAVKCNETLNWIDDYGVLISTPCYLFGAMDGKVTENFRMASGLMIMPKSNKNLEIILPYYQIKSSQRFIIKEEAWRTLERDLISSNGILYLYLVEDLVDSFNDNATLNIADYDKLNSGYIDIGLTSLTLGIGESFSFNPVLYKENKVIEGATFTYGSTMSDYYLTIAGNAITGLALGNATLVVTSVDNPGLSTSCTISVTSVGVTNDVLQIVGDEKIRWGRTRTYTVFYNSGGTPAEIAATFTLLNNSANLVSFVTQESTSCSLVGNTEGLAGTITLRATTAKGVIDKVISVVSVW